MACPANLRSFVLLCDRSPELQQRVSRSQLPSELLDLISSEGLEVSLDELKAYSRELNMAYWPWITPLGQSRRREFFFQQP